MGHMEALTNTLDSTYLMDLYPVSHQAVQEILVVDYVINYDLIGLGGRHEVCDGRIWGKTQMLRQMFASVRQQSCLSAVRFVKFLGFTARVVRI